MALKPCWECKKKISTLANTCPHCGAPKPAQLKKNATLSIKNKMRSSIGIETLGGVFTKLIEKNTKLPTQVIREFSTAEDNQPIVSIRVLQGEDELASNNKVLGNFELSGIPSAPRGVPRIVVNFQVDTKGKLNVSAKDKGTGKFQKVILKSGKPYQEVEDYTNQVETTSPSDKTSIINDSKNLSSDKKIGGTWDKFLDGKLDLATAFWGYGVFGSVIVGLICGFLAEAVGSFFIFVYIVATLTIISGLWQCANTHKKNMTAQKQSTVWGVLTQAYCVLGGLGLINFIFEYLK